MKNLFFATLIALFCCVSSLAFAFSPVMTISTYDVGQKSTSVVLDNGTVWKYKDTDLFAGPNAWQIGDRVEIMYIHYHGYFLLNKSYRGTAPVKLEQLASSNLDLPRIQSIDRQERQTESGNPIIEHKITLEDGTNWFVGSWSSSWMMDWQPGDSVIVTQHEYLFGSFNKANHMMINLDRKLCDYQKCASNVRAELTYTPTPLNSPVDPNKRTPEKATVMIQKLWKSDVNTIVELDNGMILECRFTAQNWKAGDFVRISTYDGERFHILGIIDSHRSFIDSTHGNWVNKNSNNIQCLTIQQLSQKGKKVVLNDTSTWIIKGSEPSWKIGDKVIVFHHDGKSTDENDYLVVNLTRPNSGQYFAIPSMLVK